jgi:hypothetical protein
VDDHAQQQALRVDENVALAALRFLARVIADRINPEPPFSADLTLWLSMIPADGLASRPIFSRSAISNS